MAHIVPSIAEIERSGAHSYELVTAQHLEVELGSAFTVYHGVHWNRGRRFGEIDFIVVNRDGRVLAIEQKITALTKEENLRRHIGIKRRTCALKLIEESGA